jgi:hypothetical protein
VVKRMPGLEHIAGAFYALRSAFFFASNWSWLTIDIRDNFAISIWEAAGISNIPVIFVGYYIYIHIWFVVWNMNLWLSIYWECHHPNWRTHIFHRGRSTTNQININNDWLFFMTSWVR